MGKWIIETLRTYPEIAIFLALAIGYLIGPFRIKKFSIGNVTGVLLAGVLIGQIGIEISPHVKSVFFLMFLFGVGYDVGPQFVRGLKSDGLPQAFFAVVVCAACLACVFVAAKIAGYDAGQAAGLLSGACTISAVLGVATDSINQLSLQPDQKKAMIDAMPVAYAVTYFFGTAGSAWILASLGPKILGVNLARECKEYETKMGGTVDQGVKSAYFARVVRAFEVPAGSRFAGKTIGDLENAFTAPTRVWVERIRKNKTIMEPDESIVLEPGDIIAVAATREVLLQNETDFGREADDRELLDFPVTLLDVVITSKEFEGKTLDELAKTINRERRGVFLRKLIRGGQEMPFALHTKIDRGDILQIVGATRDVERVVKVLGYPDRPTEATDVAIMGLGIALGALIGAISFPVGGVPISLSTSGGALFAGLFCGWLRSVHPTFGRIPAPALWVFKNVGLTTFIAVVGITTGPSFVQGMKQAGLSLFFWGVFVTTMPFIIGLLIGKYVFKMHPGILLGCCAGARTTTAALGAIEEEAQSKVPALGYTVPYAVGNILLISWGVVIVLLMK